MSVHISDEGHIARVVAVTQDRQKVWLHLANGAAANATTTTEFTLEPGDTVFVTDYNIEKAPPETWHSGVGDPMSNDMWVGVVSLKHPDITVVRVGLTDRRVPTTDAVEYQRGYTVEGSDARGVVRVLDTKPILRELEDIDVSDFRHEPGDQDLGFDDFGGLHEVVERAQELIELPLRQAENLAKIGARPVKGVLFTGSPGTGKTMLARIIANVAEANFYEISGPTVISKWVGESEQVLRRIFTDAAENAPSIIFFDEIDSVAGQRTEEANESSKRVVAQLLTLMDGFKAEDRVTVIAATNRPQDIDVALLRPGRFDWEIEFPLPDRNDREEMLRVSARKLSTDDPLPYEWLANHTDGWSAADLAAIWREAALVAVADDRPLLMSEDVIEGHARVEVRRGRMTIIEFEGE